MLHTSSSDKLMRSCPGHGDPQTESGKSKAVSPHALQTKLQLRSAHCCLRLLPFIGICFTTPAPQVHLLLFSFHTRGATAMRVIICHPQRLTDWRLLERRSPSGGDGPVTAGTKGVTAKWRNQERRARGWESGKKKEHLVQNEEKKT